MRTFRALLVPLLLLALLAAEAYRKPAWHDELYTRWLASRGPGAILEQLKRDSGPPLHYLLMHAWGAPARHGVEAMRFFSALCVLGAGLLVRRALEREGPGPAAAWALPVFVLMPLSLYYAAEARAYALVIFLAAALLEGMAARRHPLWLGALAAGLLLTHSLAVLLLPFLLAAPLLFGDRRLWGVPILGVLAWLPFLPVLLGQPRDSIAWMQAPVSGVQVVRFLAALAPPGPAFDLFPFPWGMALPATLAGVTALIAGLALATPGLARTAAVGFLLTSAALFAVSLGWLNVYHPSRGEVLAWPFLAVGGLAMVHRRFKPLFVHWLMGAVTLFLTVQAFVWIRGLPEGLPWEAIARGVRTHVRDGDRILVPGPWGLSLDHYLKREGCAVTVETVPADQASHPGWYRCTALTAPDRDALARTADGAEGALWLFWDRTQPCAGEAAEVLRPRPVAAFGPFRLEKVERPVPSGGPAQGIPGAEGTPAVE
jgi:hypothetical protein